MSVLGSVAPTLRELTSALALAERVAAAARDSGRPVLATSVVEADAWVLGALQRASRFSGAARVVHRATTGTAARVLGPALHHVLALPHPAAIMADGTAANFINRNVRGLLRGYLAVGLTASYFGRECLHLQKQEAGVLGVGAAGDGVLLLEALVGVEHPTPMAGRLGPLALRLALGAAGSAWKENTPLELAARIHERALRAYGGGEPLVLAPASTAALAARAPTASSASAPRAEERVLESLEWHTREVPIGLLEAARTPDGALLIRGDVLTSAPALARVAAALERNPAATEGELITALGDVPFEGARLSDVILLLREVCGSRAP